LKAPYMTVAKARKELEQIERERTAGKPRWKDVTDTQIRSLKLYYTSMEKEYAPYYTQAAQPPVNDNATKGPDAPHGGNAPPVDQGHIARRSANDRFRP